MNLAELNLSAPVEARLAEAGLHTVAAILEVGVDGLTAVNGIGPKTAGDVLAAAQATLHTAPTDGAITTGQQPVPAQTGDPNELVTVRNTASEMVLVGERYLLPGQTRTVRRRLVRHIDADRVELR